MNTRSIKLLLISMPLLLAACTEQWLNVGSSRAGSISGKVQIPSGIAAMSMTAESCTGYNVNLYAVDAQGFKTGAAVASTRTDSSGAYQLTALTALGVNLTTPGVEYLVEAEACSGGTFARPIVGDNRAQNISISADYLQKALQVAAVQGKNILAMDRAALAEFNVKLEQLGTSEFLSLYNAITLDASLSADFTKLFGFSPTLLANNLPVVAPPLSMPASVNEGQSLSVAVQAEHWRPGYDIAYQWSLEGSVIGTDAVLNYNFGKNTQGLRTLRLMIGRFDGNLGIDASSPVFSKNYLVSVRDTYPAVPPALSKQLPAGVFAGTRSLTLRIATGSSLSACESFSTLAVTEDDFIPPLSPSAYTLTCTATANQDFLFPLTTSGDGVKTLRLWARDSIGNVSVVPSVVTVNLDEIDPAVTLSDLASTPLKGGSATTVLYSISDVNGISSANLLYSPDGTSFSPVATLSAAQTAYVFNIPLDATAMAKLRIVATDNALRATTVTTAAFTIDSIAPSALTLTRTSAALTNLLAVNLAVGGCSGDAVRMLFKETASAPTANDVAWEPCASAKIFSLAAGDGPRSIYGFAKDAAGNISAATGAVSVTLDQTLPNVSWTTGLTGQFLKGASTASLTFSAGDANFSATPIRLEQSIDNGVTWTTVNASLPVSSYTWTVPSVESTQMKLRLIATDAAGNETSAVTGVFGVATAMPTISAFQLNGGAATTTSAYVSTAVSATSLTAPITQFCLKNTATAPLLADNCWRNLNLPQPNVVPSRNISFTGFNYFMSFLPGPYTVYAWVTDAAGNISAGDSGSVTLQAPSPPVVSKLVVANTAAPSDPVASSQKNFTGSQSAFVKWRATATSTATITLSYKNNVGATVEIAAGLANGSNGGCTVNGASTVDDTATGCYTWTNAPATYFSVTVKATDTNHISVEASSYPLNAPAIQILAGKTDLGVGTSALSSVLKVAEQWTDIGTLTVATDGRVFMRDRTLGLVMVDPRDGILQRLIPITGTASGDGGPVTSATLCAAQKIAIDFQDRVLIFDCTKIRRVNTSVSPMTIETIIGGGSTQVDATSALSFQIINPGTADYAYSPKTIPFFALPNGDIYFASGYGLSVNAGYRIRKYRASDEKVYSIAPSGIGHSENPTLDITTMANYIGVGFVYDPTNSNFTKALYSIQQNYVGDAGGATVNLDPVTFVSTAPHPMKSSRTDYFIQGMDGNLYIHDGRVGTFRKFDPTSGTYTTLVGGGTDVACADGVLATSCKVNNGFSGFDAFVTAAGQIYFVNHIGIVRTVLADKTVRRVIGQGKGDGDNGPAVESRANKIMWMDQASDGTIFFNDFGEVRIRKFTIDGAITHHANLLTTAVGNVLNPATKDIYSRMGVNSVKLTFSTAAWATVNSLNQTYNSELNGAYDVFGFDGLSTILYTLLPAWDSVSGYRNVKLGSSNVATPSVTLLTGYTGSTKTFCAGGTSAATCTVPWLDSLSNPRAQYDALPATPRWIMLEGARVVALNKGGMTTSEVLVNVATLPRAARSFVYRKLGSNEIIDYCASNGKLYSYNITTLTDAAYAWPITALTCDGVSLNYNSSRDSLMFPARQNGLSAIVEYKLNP